MLTAAIDVGTTPEVAVADPGTRLAEYRRALAFYLALPGLDGLLFCENTGHDLAALQALDPAGRVEFLRISDPARDLGRGKGHAELGIVLEALATSRTIRAEDLVVKVTGRYLVRNLPRLAASLRANPGYDVVGDLRRTLTRVDTRVCAFRPAFAATYLAPQRARIDDRRGVFLEHAFARATLLALADGGRWRPWAVEPDIEGVSGTGGDGYQRGPLRRAYRATLRRLQWATLQR